ncbi:ARPP-1 family domain-containing protein [Methanomethylovorans sp.]|uniref:ARPP-1 family domain-containing protein n=1 Tax=Methanomethylovorans sp. TaxID=2758717 RepID=UPI00351C8790
MPAQEWDDEVPGLVSGITLSDDSGNYKKIMEKIMENIMERNCVENVVGDMLRGLRTGKITEFKNMAVVPLCHDNDTVGGYITLKEGLEAGTLTIHEISMHGSVPELVAVNTGHLPVLILDGEELAGAKQNRAVNTTIMVPALTKVNIPVSCTEQGRWSYKTNAFSDSDVIMSHRTRRNRSASVTESLVNERGFCSDQGQVWDNIRSEAAFANASSSTGAMRDTLEHLRPRLEDYINAFPLGRRKNGFVVFINGNPMGMEMISSSGKYALLHTKLIRSYATEAIYNEGEEDSATAEQAMKFIKEAALCTFERYPSVGLGEDYRFVGNEMIGSSLIVNGTVVHCAFFRREHFDGQQFEASNGMQDSRSRRETQFKRNMVNRMQDVEPSI